MTQLRLDRKTLSQVTFPEGKVSKLVFYAQSFPEKIPSLDNYAVKVPPQNKNRENNNNKPNRTGTVFFPYFRLRSRVPASKPTLVGLNVRAKKEEKEETRARTSRTHAPPHPPHARTHTHKHRNQKRTHADHATDSHAPRITTTPTKPGHTLTSMERPHHLPSLPPPAPSMTLQRPGQGQRVRKTKDTQNGYVSSQSKTKGNENARSHLDTVLVCTVTVSSSIIYIYIAARENN